MISHVALEQQIASDLLAAESTADLEKSDAATDRAYAAQCLALATAARTSDDLAAKQRIFMAELADRFDASDFRELRDMLDSLIADARAISG